MSATIEQKSNEIYKSLEPVCFKKQQNKVPDQYKTEDTTQDRLFGACA